MIQDTIEIKKSKFICQRYDVSTKEECDNILSQIHQQHKKATHICYAYVLENTAKFSDDGEPSGTAGRPILGVIQKKHKTNVLVVVIRYFGGIKLGAGGLIRAYTKSASNIFDV